ncbi:MAG: hypothetical protein JNK82_36385, partial [Myxococcaceae bacterium]|nr:hypothetical protein [Myxococcaceae bacterium]
MWLAAALLFAAVPVSDWQYRWGEAGEWSPIRLPGHPPRGEGDLWERTQLPPLGTFKDPALKLDAVIGHFELFVDGERRYVHPPEGIDAKGLAGLPWHLVRLPPNAHDVSLRVKTSYRLAGIQAVPQLGERGDLIEAVVRTDTPRLLIGALMVLLAVLGFVLLPKTTRVDFAVYTGSGGAYAIYYTELKQLVLPLTPSIWFAAWVVTLALIPVGYLRFSTVVFHEPPRAVLFMRRVHELYGLGFVAVIFLAWGALGLWGFEAERFASPLLFVLGAGLRLLMLVTSAVCFAHAVKLARGRGPDRANARILLVAFTILLGAIVLNVGASLGLLPTMRGAYVTPGLFALALALAVVAQRSWAQTRLQLADRVKEKEAMLRDLH